MNKKIFVALSLIMLISFPMRAEKATKEYQRPSLHMVLLNTDEPTSDLVADLMPTVSASWDNYTIPKLYNDFDIAFKSMNAGSPKGGMIELMTKYPDPSVFASMTLEQLKELQELINGKQYLIDLRARCDEQKALIAHQLVAKWFNITPEGTCDLDTICKYACYSATQAASNAATELGQSAFFEMFNQLMIPTISNTYVDFAKVSFYANEPIELFNKNVALAVIDLTASIASQAGGMVAVAAAATQASSRAIAEAAYEKTKEGYRAYTASLLYRLKWNEDIQNALNAIMTIDPNTGKGTIDYQKFQEMNFDMEFINNDACHTIVRLNTETKGMSKEEMVKLCVHKNLNKQLVNLQNKNEEFRPMVPLLLIDKKFMLADMGTKEGVKEGDQFDVLNPVTDANGITTYKWVGTVKVAKKGVWDNVEIDNTLTADAQGNDGSYNGTQLSVLKMATTNMLVKKKKASK